MEKSEALALPAESPVSALSVLDALLFREINSRHTPFLDFFFGEFTKFGLGSIGIPLAVVYAAVRVGFDRLLGMSVYITVCSILAFSFLSIIKRSTKRKRPLKYFKKYAPFPYKVHVVGRKLKSRSMPSGHTSVAFCIATAATLLLGGWHWLFFVPALLVGYSRIYIGAHFPADVVAGALIGSLTFLAGFQVWQHFLV